MSGPIPSFCPSQDSEQQRWSAYWISRRKGVSSLERAWTKTYKNNVQRNTEVYNCLSSDHIWPSFLQLLPLAKKYLPVISVLQHNLISEAIMNEWWIVEDELGSQKLLVKNHCSTNQHADGFRDPRQDVGQQKQQMCDQIWKSDSWFRSWSFILARPGKNKKTLNFNYLNYFANPQIAAQRNIWMFHWVGKWSVNDMKVEREKSLFCIVCDPIPMATMASMKFLLESAER